MWAYQAEKPAKSPLYQQIVLKLIDGGARGKDTSVRVYSKWTNVCFVCTCIRGLIRVKKSVTRPPERLLPTILSNPVIIFSKRERHPSRPAQNAIARIEIQHGKLISAVFGDYVTKMLGNGRRFERV